MSRIFSSKNQTKPLIKRVLYRQKWNNTAYPQNRGLGKPVIKNNHFVERIHYGFVDNFNSPVIPNEDFMVNVENGRVFDFVADSYSLMKLSLVAAAERGVLTNDNGIFSNLRMIHSYSNPKIKYGEYLGDILQYYNETHIPFNIGNNSITQYNDYVNNFFKLFFEYEGGLPLTLSRWVTSTNSSILDTGVAFMYRDMDYDDDQRKEDDILSNRNFKYFQDLCMNMGFSILKDNPNILCYDLASPAGSSIRNKYNLFNLNYVFENRFIKTCFIDIDILFNNINIYYNKYVLKNPELKTFGIDLCGITTQSYHKLESINIDYRFPTEYELEMYIKIRNHEEGSPFQRAKLKTIYEKSIYFLKKLDKPSAIGYIDNSFRDQLWNKPHGFHDLRQKLKAKQTEAQRQQAGGGPSSGGSSY
tara:strand:+ start:784 stop:2031 length:1248 start_codon:yes stop_codon:yes gene_type:complete